MIAESLSANRVGAVVVPYRREVEISMARRYVIWVLIPLIFGVGAYAVGKSRLGRSLANRGVPVLVYPRRVELGERELGEVAVARITVVNRGGKELRIDEIQSSCSCSGLEREIDGKFVRVDSLNIAPGENVKINFRMAVGGTPGDPMQSLITFRSNDPREAIGEIHGVVSKVNGGATTVPTSVNFGLMPVGSERREFLDVYDSSRPPQALDRAVSLASDLALVSVVENAKAPESTVAKLGTWIGRIEVRALALEQGALDTGIHIHLVGESRPPPVVPISGRVGGPVSVLPATLVLPRNSQSGPVFFGECVCQSISGEPFTLEVVDIPPGLTANVQSKSESDSQMVRIEWDGNARAEPAEPGPRGIRLKAMVEGQVTMVKIPVFCLRKE